MYKIRAVTLHVKFYDCFPNLKEAVEYVDSQLDKLEYISRELGKNVEILSKRLVLPSLEEMKRKIKNFELNALSLFEDYLKRRINYYNMPIVSLNHPALEQDLPNLFSSTDHFYSSICLAEKDCEKRETLEKAITILKNISRLAGWLSATRFAFSIGPQPLTPYFPVTSSPLTGYTISLLYVNDLLTEVSSSNENCLIKLENKIKKICENIKNKALEISSRTGLAFLGVDLSISPWLEESVVPLIEKIKGDISIGTPGTLHTLYKINSVLEKVSRSGKVIGFNEIMLPLAEDNGLKRRVREGDIGFKELMMYCLACVAGLDMVPIPEWTEDKVLIHLFKDLFTIYAIKKKVLGVRLIPVNVEAGEEVDLGIFGKTPVLDLF
ncbi:MAG: hypothetical protein DRJ38_02475 [Thermoprotei archaeon]|nr:MAG: hypothetical protein DRJ38_02475 [Thermoprotei archaeon]